MSAVMAGDEVIGDVDKRGPHAKDPVVNQQNIQNHIWKFHPNEHHYRNTPQTVTTSQQI